MKGAISFLLSLLILTACKEETVRKPASSNSRNSTVGQATLMVEEGTTINFGSAMVGLNTSRLMTIRNTGTQRASSLSVSFQTGGNAFSFEGGNYPGTGGNCTTEVSSGMSCTVQMRFSPSAAGNSTGTTSISYFNGLSKRTLTESIDGIGISTGSVSFSPLSTSFGSVNIGLSQDRTVTLTHSGGTMVSSIAGSLSAPYSFKGGNFPGTGGTCGTTLGVGSNCNLVVTYAPTAVGSQNQNLVFTYNNGLPGNISSTSAHSLSGTGVGNALLTFSQTSTDFGSSVIGTIVDRTLTVTNSGGSQASGLLVSGLSDPFLFKGASGNSNYPGNGGTCGAILIAGGSCTLVISFIPIGASASSSTIQLNYQNGAITTPTTHSLTGTGLSQAALSSAPSSVDFGTLTVGNSPIERTLTVTNSGGGNAISISGLIALPFSFKGGSYPGTGGSCGASVLGDQSCTLVIQFSPLASGGASGSLNLSYSDGVTAKMMSVALSGAGIDSADLVFSPLALDFGTLVLGSIVPNQTVTLKNVGQTTASGLGPLTTSNPVAPPFFFDGGSYSGTGGSCGGTLLSGATCTLVIGANPIQAGTHTTNLELTYSDGVSSKIAALGVSVIAKTRASLSFSSSTLDFGSAIINGDQVEKTVTLSNSGDSDATDLKLSGVTSPYSYKGGNYTSSGTCGTTLVAHGSCSLSFIFSPKSLGSAPLPLSLSYNNGLGGTSAPLNFLGQGISPAQITLFPTLVDFGDVVIGGNGEKQITITNIGNVAADQMQVHSLSSPFSFKGGSYPGTGGTCGVSLSSNGSCDLVLSFNPTSPSPSTLSAKIKYQNGLTLVEIPFDLSGVGKDRAFLVFNPSFLNFGKVIIGQKKVLSVEIQNNGGVEASGLNFSLSAANSPFNFESSGTCDAILSPLNKCEVFIGFTPISGEAFINDLVLNYIDGLIPQRAMVNMLGSGNPNALLVFEPISTYDFGTHIVDSPRRALITLKNTGTVDASSIVMSRLSSFNILSTTCEAILNPNGDCWITIGFRPQASASYSETLSVTYHDGNESKSLDLILLGSGKLGALFSFLASSENFSTVEGVPVSKKVTLFNSGESGGDIEKFPLIPSSHFSLGTSFKWPSTLAPGTGCDFELIYAPNTLGNHAADFVVNYFDGQQHSNAVLPLSGSALKKASLVMSVGNSLNMGTTLIGTQKLSTVTVSNSGEVAAGNFVFDALSAPFSILSHNCGASLSPNQTCDIQFKFFPIKEGTFNGSFSLTYSNGVSSVNRPLSLTGFGSTGFMTAFLNGVDITTPPSLPLDIGLSNLHANPGSIQTIVFVNNFSENVVLSELNTPTGFMARLPDRDPISPGGQFRVSLLFEALNVGELNSPKPLVIKFSSSAGITSFSYMLKGGVVGNFDPAIPGEARTRVFKIEGDSNKTPAGPQTLEVINNQAVPLNLGSVEQYHTAPKADFKIYNYGELPLQISKVEVTNPDIRIVFPEKAIHTFQFATLKIVVMSEHVGSLNGQIKIYSNDLSQSPFIIPIEITVFPQGPITDITTVAQLKGIEKNLDGNYRLANDINMFETIFPPISRFKGDFNGNGFKIFNFGSDNGLMTTITGSVRNLKIENFQSINGSTTGAAHGGLAYTTERGSLVENVEISGYIENCFSTCGSLIATHYGVLRDAKSSVTIKQTSTLGSTSSFGGLVGVTDFGALISRSSFSGRIDRLSSGYRVGGLTGGLSGQSVIEDSNTKGQFIGGQSHLGGFVGEIWGHSLISRSFSSMTLSNRSEGITGGFAGSAREGSSIIDSYATGSVSGTDRVGGFVGIVYEGVLLQNIYSTGDVVNTGNYTGGLVSSMYSNSIVRNAYASGNVSGGNYVGGFASVIADSTVENSYATGNVFGKSIDINFRLAGLIVLMGGTSKVIHSYATGTVSSDPTSVANYVGGLVASVGSGGQITDSFYSGKIIIPNADYFQTSGIGGLVGGASEALIDRCYSEGDVKPHHEATNVGGLVGKTSDSTIRDSYSSARVSGKREVGGLVGTADNSNVITNCYSMGQVIGEPPATYYPYNAPPYTIIRAGGLIGSSSSESVFPNSFFDIDTSRLTISAGGSGQFSPRMLTKYHYPWDFNTVWSFETSDGISYPILRGLPNTFFEPFTARIPLRNEINDLYLKFLNRAADSEGLNFQEDMYYRNGGICVVNESLGASDEFYDLNGNDNLAYVTALYQKLFLRDPDAGGLSYFTDRLNAGVTRNNVVKEMIKTKEFKEGASDSSYKGYHWDHSCSNY